MTDQISKARTRLAALDARARAEITLGAALTAELAAVEAYIARRGK